MRRSNTKIKWTVFLSIFLSAILSSCAPRQEYKTFAEAHDAFQTKLVKEKRDREQIPAPPEGVFDLVDYPTKIGDMAAYVSSDPGDGQKHPMIVWVVGGWGNGIDEFPWSYPSWDNDQTASAFWQAGVLTMYPSFRGGCGNPGHYEALFGEVDDLVSALAYAKTLPYVDPDRIYLGGHSTGATRVLLASEYTDQFRAAFCFGPVDHVKYHNHSQFTFDTSNQEEYVMRSPIYWLEDVKRPTFIIEGMGGNSARVKNIQNKSQNSNISCYIIDGADHFTGLAPVTGLVAQKILGDTGEETNITISPQELWDAMKEEPITPMPIMTQYQNEDLGLSFSYPFMWEVSEDENEGGKQIYLESPTYDDNIWDASSLGIYAYPTQGTDNDNIGQYFEELGFEAKDVTISGKPVREGYGVVRDESGESFVSQVLVYDGDDILIEMYLNIHESFGKEADPLFQKILDSVELK